MQVGFLHGHPSGFPAFSDRDDANERALLAAAQNRNGHDASLVSLLALPKDQLIGRIWQGSAYGVQAQILETGHRMRLHPTSPVAPSSALDRQVRVFGAAFSIALRRMKFTIVGAGGTGSPLAIMLARAGAGHIAIIDFDTVEETNLHRLYGATMADIGRPKAQVLAERINALGLHTTAIDVQEHLMDKVCRDALKASDMVFCATDDHAGRMLLNRFAYFYDIPVIDMGLAVAGEQAKGRRDMTGRVTRLHPGAPCLLCRGIVNPIRARQESLARRAPAQYEQQQKDGYILGGGDPEPAFISMTTSVACMALEELAQAFCEFRGKDGDILQRFRRFQIPEDRKAAGVSDPDCPICNSTAYWGMGDMKPFLDRVG